MIGCLVADVKDVSELAPLLFVPQLLFAGDIPPSYYYLHPSLPLTIISIPLPLTIISIPLALPLTIISIPLPLTIIPIPLNPRFIILFLPYLTVISIPLVVISIDNHFMS